MYPEIVFSIFILFFLIQLVYQLYFFYSIAISKDDQKSDRHKPVSVIVCAHNEYENLQKLIPALLRQSYHQFEIVIVNDRSYDETELYLKDIVLLHGSKIKVVTIEETPSKMDPKKYALTLGIKAAANEHLIFTDADCLPYNDKWILHMQSKFGEDHKMILGISQYEEKPGFLNLFIRYETFYTAVQYLSFALRGMPYMGVGRNLAYTKSLFFENKGFHPFVDVTGGDDDLFVNKAAQSTSVVVITHIEGQTVSIPKPTWKDWYTQKVRHLSVGKLYPTNIKSLLGLLNFSHLGIYILFIMSLFDDKFFLFTLAGFLLRIIINCIIFSMIINKLRYRLLKWSLPMFDLIYPVYYIIIGLRALTIRKIRWK